MKARPAQPRRRPTGGESAKRGRQSPVDRTDSAPSTSRAKTPVKDRAKRPTTNRAKTPTKSRPKTAPGSGPQQNARGAGSPVAAFEDFVKRRRRLRYIITTSVAGGLAVLIALVAIAYLTPVLAVDHVTVSGTKTISAGAVKKTVGEQVRGVPLPRVSDGDVARSVRQKFRAAADVDVSKSLPATIEVDVDERVPVAVTGTSGHYRLVDENGGTIRMTAKAPKDLPVLDIDVSKAGSGAVKSALAALDALPDDLADRVDKMSAKSATSVVFELHDGPKVRWGNGSKPDFKVKVLKDLLKTDAGYINVSVPQAPTTK